MRTPHLLVACLFAGTLMGGCDDGGGGGGGGTGTLEMHITIGDGAPAAHGTKAVHAALDIIDVRHVLHSLQVSQGTVADGQPNDLVWYTIYASPTEIYDSQLTLSASLPAGDYSALRILQSNYLYWVVTDGSNTYELLNLNDAASALDAQIENIFGVDGLYELDGSSNFALVTTGEKMGTTFTVTAGATTVLTVRTNLDTVDWDDADDSGDWSAGDSCSNETLIPGATTMADFLVQ